MSGGVHDAVKVPGVRRTEFLAGAVAASFIQSSPARLSIVAAPLGHDIDPYRDPERGVDELAWLYADGLVGPDERPLLAASPPEVRDGGRTYRYTLRDVAWHDGAALTARDVQAAFRELRGGIWGTHEPYRSVRDIVRLDDRRFDVRLHEKRAGFVRSFFGPSGVPALPLIRHAADGTPIGTGPFAIAGRPESERWVLRRWDGSPRGKPLLAEIALRLIGFAPTRAIQMRTEEAHMAIPLAPEAITGPYLTHRRLTSVATLLFNAASIFRSARLRRLCATTVDVPALQKHYINRPGSAVFASLLMNGPNDAAWERALTRRTRGAGDELHGALGDALVRLSYVAGSPAHERTMLVVQQMLASAGVASELRAKPMTNYLSNEGPLRAGDFDIGIVGYPNLDGSDLAADWSCNNIPPRGGNFARWCDGETERALHRGDTVAVLRRLYDEMAVLPLGIAEERIGVSLRLAGVAAPMPLVPFTYQCVDWHWA